MKHNSLGDDVPIVVILRAMGAMSDQEIVQLVSFLGFQLVCRQGFGMRLTSSPCNHITRRFSTKSFFPILPRSWLMRDVLRNAGRYNQQNSNIVRI